MIINYAQNERKDGRTDHRQNDAPGGKNRKSKSAGSRFGIYPVSFPLCLSDQMEADAYRVGGLLGVFEGMDGADTKRWRFSFSGPSNIQLYLPLYVSHVSGFLSDRE